MTSTTTSPILVTGGAGYIGSHIVYMLRDQGYEVVVVDNLCNARRDILPRDVVFHQTDIHDTAAMTAVMQQHKITTVIHLAAHLSVEESVSQPLKYYQNNVGGTCALLEACTKAGVTKFIFSSTGSTYASSDQPMAEDALTDPCSPYSMSKLMAERVIRDTVNTTRMKAVILRYFNVAGADPQGRTGQQGNRATHLISRALQAANGDAGQLCINGTDYPTIDGTCVRDYIHVSDLAQAHLAVMEKEFDTNYQLFNCGYGSGFSVKQVVERVPNITDRQMTVTTGPRRAGDIAQSIANNNAILSETNWQPQYNDLDVMIGTAWQWYQQEAERLKK